MKHQLRFLACAGALYFGLGQTAVACAFHGYIPDPTLVDIILGSEHVVVARPDPKNPDQYMPVAALVGPPHAGNIPLPVDSETRAQLNQNLDDTVLIARDGAYGPWLKLAMLDDDYRALVDTVVARQSAWSLGDDEDRYQVFAARVNDPNPDIRHLALLELDRADYSILRRLHVSNVPSLQRDLDSGNPDLRPIRILLAGLSKDERLIPILSNGLDLGAKQDIPYLGAYATALIELGGPEAVGEIVNSYVVPAALPVQTREKVIEALAIHAQTGAEDTKNEIQRRVAELLDQSPNMAGAVARQFGFRGDWSLSEPLKHAIRMHPPSSIEDVFAINQYIGIADRG